MSTPLELLKPEQVMTRLGYKDRKSFLVMARKKGLRSIRINARVIRFDPVVTEAWLARRAA